MVGLYYSTFSAAVACTYAAHFPLDAPFLLTLPYQHLVGLPTPTYLDMVPVAAEPGSLACNVLPQIHCSMVPLLRVTLKYAKCLLPLAVALS